MSLLFQFGAVGLQEQSRMSRISEMEEILKFSKVILLSRAEVSFKMSFLGDSKVENIPISSYWLIYAVMGASLPTVRVSVLSLGSYACFPMSAEFASLTEIVHRFILNGFRTGLPKMCCFGTWITLS